jgi:L-histidine N-alpha-methyltransferase
MAVFGNPAGRRRLTPARVRIDVRLDAAARRRALVADIGRGLRAQPKTVPPKYLYDARGSALFDRITRLPEYYPTRAETSILRACAASLMARLAPDEIVEIGAGTGEKLRLLLDARPAGGDRLRYVPVDVDAVTMAAAARTLTARYEFLDVHGVVGDFERHLRLVPAPRARRLVLFLGSTIGNLEPAARTPFLRRVRALLGPGGRFVIGLDLVKSPAVLHAAYDDRAGVTAEFNRNVLHVVNRALRANFVPQAFRHVARYDADAARVEMHLVADALQRVTVRDLDLRVTVAPGEGIWTESSYKFTRTSATAMLEAAGLGVESWHTDRRGRFAVVVAAPASPAHAA